MCLHIFTVTLFIAHLLVAHFYKGRTVTDYAVKTKNFILYWTLNNDPITITKRVEVESMAVLRVTVTQPCVEMYLSLRPKYIRIFDKYKY